MTYNDDCCRMSLIKELQTEEKVVERLVKEINNGKFDRNKPTSSYCHFDGSARNNTLIDSLR